MEEKNKAYATFEERDRIASLGGGTAKIEKQHESGKMTARERIDMLLDKGTFVELDKLMVHRCTNYGMDKNKIPGDGIVSGYGKIDGRQVFVYAYDFTVYGGSLSASNAKKIVKVQQLALKNGAPIIALNDSGGARIQEGIESLSGYADIFYQNTMASGVIPQISAILGPCAGGACYSPALTDFIFMVKEQSHMFVTGPDVVKTVIHEEVSKEELGGAMAHSSKSGVTHFICNTEEELLMSIRELLSFLPQNNMDETKKQNCTDEINREDTTLDTIVPTDPNVPYDMKDIIERVVDNGYFFDAAVGSYLVVALHLHGFDNDNRISGFHFLTYCHGDFYYFARHWGSNTVVLFCFPFLAHAQVFRLTVYDFDIKTAIMSVYFIAFPVFTSN